MKFLRMLLLTSLCAYANNTQALLPELTQGVKKITEQAVEFLKKAIRTSKDTAEKKQRLYAKKASEEQKERNAKNEKGFSFLSTCKKIAAISNKIDKREVTIRTAQIKEIQRKQQR